MAVDPLSQATRTAKRNLLAASMLAVTYKTFNVTIETIPIAGIGIRFDKGAFGFLLITSVAYFGLTFALYYFIDIKDLTATTHQIATFAKYGDKLREFRRWSISKLVPKLSASLAPRFSVASNDVAMLSLFEAHERSWKSIDHAHLLNEIVRTSPSPTPFTLVEYDQATRKEARKINLGPGLREICAPTVTPFANHLRWHRWVFRFYQFALLPWVWCVQSVYAVRNYGTDGLLPISVAIIAILGMYDVISFAWILPIIPLGTR